MAKIPAVILNMHYTGLGVARNLAHLGIPIYALSSVAGFPGNFSRFVRFRLAPDSLAQPAELLAFLAALARETGERPVLFPTRDHDLQFIAAHRAELEKDYRIPFSDSDVMEGILNKDKCFEAAKACGIAFPRSATVDSEAGMRAAAGDLKAPWILKPLYASQWRKPGIWEAVGSQKALKIGDASSLMAIYARFAAMDPLCTLQEWIPGGEERLVVFGSYADGRGSIPRWFTGRKRLQYPALYGTGVVVESHPVPEIEAPSRALLARLRFQGVSEIEFKLDPAGTPYLIEVNPRQWDQHRLGHALGVNLSEAAYLDATGSSVPPARAADVRARWIAEYDMGLHLLRCIRPGGPSLIEALGLLRGRKVWSVWSASDPKPGLRLAWNLFTTMLSLVKAKLVKGR